MSPPPSLLSSFLPSLGPSFSFLPSFLGCDAMRQTSFFFLAVGFGNRDAAVIVVLLLLSPLSLPPFIPSFLPSVLPRLSPLRPPGRPLSLSFALALFYCPSFGFASELSIPAVPAAAPRRRICRDQKGHFCVVSWCLLTFAHFCIRGVRYLQGRACDPDHSVPVSPSLDSGGRPPDDHFGGQRARARAGVTCPFY